ncbi:MAG: histidine phosphatase family protein [Cystobacter sp.]
MALLLRHAARPPIPPGEWGDSLALTVEGVLLARQLGEHLGARLVALHTSPVARCVQTARLLGEGSRSDTGLQLDSMLGAPGAFISDGRLGGETLQRLGLDAFVDHLISGEGTLPGLAEPAAAARALVEHLLTRSGHVPGLHVFVTHDSLLAPTVARVLRHPRLREHWPGFLEAAFFWRERRGTRGVYRDHEARLEGR